MPNRATAWKHIRVVWVAQRQEFIFNDVGCGWHGMWGGRLYLDQKPVCTNLKDPLCVVILIS